MHKLSKQLTTMLSMAALVVSSFGTFISPVLADAGTGTGTTTTPSNQITPVTQPPAYRNIYTQWTVTLSPSVYTQFARTQWVVESGSLPAGMSLVASSTNLRSATIQGEPLVDGSYPIRLRGDTSFSTSTSVYKDYVLVVRPIEIEARTYPNAQAGVAYSQYVNVLGGVSPYRYIVTAGQLPSGLSIDSTGRISGTPNYALPYTFTLTAIDANGHDASREISITVDPDAALAIATTVVPGGTVGTAYSSSLSATGGTAAYRWSLIGGSLPPGINLNSSAQLVGTPTTAGTYTFKFQVTDAASRTVTREFTATIAERGTTTPTTTGLRILSSALPSATVGTWYGYTIGGSGGTVPYTWSLQSGTVPPGLTVEGGSVYGNPTVAGSYTFLVKLQDARGTAATQSYTMQVNGTTTVTPTPTTPTTPTTPVTPTVTPVVETPSAIAERENRVRNLDRAGIAVHALVKLPNDGNPATQEDTAVYYVGSDGRRHSFPNNKVYSSWYSDFSGVRVITGAELASIPLGASVTYKPGVKLVKFATDPRVYAVSTNRTLRFVGTEALATSLYGATWNRQIDDIPDTFYSDYSFGAAVNSSAEFNPATMRGMVSYVSDVLAM